MSLKNLTILALLVLPFTVFSQAPSTTMKLRYDGFVSFDSTKNFVVLEVPGKAKKDLFTSALVYLNTIYNNPQAAISSVTNESIVINGFTESIRGSLDWYRYPTTYRINLQFKDGKIRFEPTINEITEIADGNLRNRIYLVDTDSPKKVEMKCIWITRKDGSHFLFDKHLNSSIESWINRYISAFVDGLKKSDW